MWHRAVIGGTDHNKENPRDHLGPLFTALRQIYAKPRHFAFSTGKQSLLFGAEAEPGDQMCVMRPIMTT
jgi:hypothetical protein